MKKYQIVILVLVAVTISLLIYINRRDAVDASSSISSVTSEADWSQGTISNIDYSSSPGSIEIDESGESKITGGSWFTDDPDNNTQDVHDGNTSGGYLTVVHTGNYDIYEGYIVFEFESTKNLSKIRFFSNSFSLPSVNYYAGAIPWDPTEHFYVEGGAQQLVDGWSGSLAGCTDTVGSGNRWIECDIDDTQSSMIILTLASPWIPEQYDVYEVEAYEAGGSATHTTAATQIDGQEGSADKEVIEWTSFTPTQTTPANTSISYEFRTSDDASSWSAWSASQSYAGTPLDLTSLTPSRYLQVRSTLSTTDAAATPQIDDYTINFHNNLKPNRPTAQTAIIGD